MLGLGVKTNRFAMEENGYINDQDTRWTHDLAGSSTSLDNLTNLTIIAHYSFTGIPPQTSGYNFPAVIHASDESVTNHTGFLASFQYASKKSNYAYANLYTNWSCADGSGAKIAKASAAAPEVARFGGQMSINGSAEGNCKFSIVWIFDESRTNAMESHIISNSVIESSVGVNSVANLGPISGKVNIEIGDNANSGGFRYSSFQLPTIALHKLSIWNETLSDSDILKLVGLTGTLQDTDAADIQGYYHNVTRFRSYSDLSINTPEHEWDFSKAELGNNTSTVNDTGNQSVLNMTAVNNPPIFSRAKNLL